MQISGLRWNSIDASDRQSTVAPLSRHFLAPDLYAYTTQESVHLIERLSRPDALREVET